MTTRSVEYAEFGAPSVLKLVEVPIPDVAAGQVRVRVHAAGLNPIDAKLFAGGPIAEAFGVTLPAGNGNDFAGVIEAVGDGVTGFEIGDAVLGRTARAQSTYVIAEPSALVAKPEQLSFETAAGLPGVGLTAGASVDSLHLTVDDVVLISAAAGGVGVLQSQLVRRTGATVIGTASKSNHDFLRTLGVIPVEYGDGMIERIRNVAPRPLTTALDNHGRETIDAAIELGVPVKRINTIADVMYANEIGAPTVGASSAGPDTLTKVVELIAQGELQLPIDSTFAAEHVVQAYEHLLSGHLRGKVILTGL